MNFEIKTVYLESGWSEKSEFSDKVNVIISDWALRGWVYYDIKISSKDNNCLLIFKRWVSRL